MGEIVLILNNSIIASGQDITGIANLIISNPVETKILKFVFKGKEKTYFKKQSTSGEYFKKYHGEKTIIKIELDMHEWKAGYLDPGEHRFPFMFETPFELPSSFSFKSSKESGEITYHIKAYIEDTSGGKLFKTSQAIKIIQNIDIKDTPTTEFLTPLLTCNCISRGFCVTTIELSKKKYAPGGICDFTIFLDNSQAKVDINNLECILWLVCRFLNTEKKVHYFRKCVYFHQHSKTIKYTDTLLTPQEIKLKVPLDHKKIDLSNCSTTFGELVQCTYSLQVTLEFGSIIIEEPDMQMPIHVSLVPEKTSCLVEDSLIRLSRDLYK
jgi:Arrestin (or S-antigen), N-terminal domain/Arrestin (or S-antigen), C-terminal domain